MLKKMGWSRGKGLGANEDGNIENVKIGLKQDNKGNVLKFRLKFIEFL